MPIATHPAVLRAVYDEASRLIQERAIPTDILTGPRTVFRSFSKDYVKITPNGAYPRLDANKALIIPADKGTNRFTGAPLNPGLPMWGGLYCSAQQQAQVNELLYYARGEVVNPAMVERKTAAPMLVPRDPKTGFPHVGASLNLKCIVQIRVMGSMLVADLSGHNPGAERFLEKLAACTAVQDALRAAGGPGHSMWDWMCDGDDCSVARGIGLAIANSGHLRALLATTVRPSPRSEEEAGDNIVFFGREYEQVRDLWVEKAYLFPISGPMIILPVA